MNNVLRELKSNYQHQNKPFLEIRLDGMIHTTDQVAMREICKQLSLEQELEERSFVRGPFPFLCLWSFLVFVSLLIIHFCS